MGIKLLRGTTGRSGRSIFSRDLIDFEMKFERVWQDNEVIGPASLDDRMLSRNGDLEAKKREESPEGEREPDLIPLLQQR